jgi:site-specific DNA recombinase
MSSPLLLAGVANCTCGGALTLRTGTSKNGNIHRYYHCSRNNHYGSAECSGQNVPEAILDNAVLTAVSERILALPHLTSLLEALVRIQAEDNLTKNKALPALSPRKAESDKALKGLLAVLKQDPDLADNSV